MKTLFALLIPLLTFHLTLSGQNNCFEHCWENLESASKEPVSEEFKFPYQKVLTYLEGCQMPPFEYKTLNGNYLVPESLRGRVVVMNFWFESCTPCRNEMPGLNKLASYFKGKDVIFVAFGRDSARSIREFLRSHEFNFLHVPDSFNTGALDCFCVMGGFPTTMIFDKKGKLINSIRGGSVDPAKQYEIFDKLQPIIEKALMN